MYLAFCSRRCEESYFGTNAGVVPLDGKRLSRPENIEIMDKLKLTKKKKKKLENSRPVETTKEVDETTDMGVDETADFSADSTYEMTADTTATYTSNPYYRPDCVKRSLAAFENEFANGASGESEASTTDYQYNGGQNQSAPHLSTQPLPSSTHASAALQPGPAQQVPTVPQPMSAHSPAVQPPQPRFPGDLDGAPPTPPQEMPMYEDGEAAEARAVCVRIRDKSFKVQLIKYLFLNIRVPSIARFVMKHSNFSSVCIKLRCLRCAGFAISSHSLTGSGHRRLRIPAACNGWTDQDRG